MICQLTTNLEANENEQHEPGTLGLGDKELGHSALDWERGMFDTRWWILEWYAAMPES